MDTGLRVAREDDATAVADAEAIHGLLALDDGTAGGALDAERSYRLALAREPDSPAILNNLAQVLLEQKRCGHALEAIGRALAASEPRADLLGAVADSHARILSRCADD